MIPPWGRTWLAPVLAQLVAPPLWLGLFRLLPLAAVVLLLLSLAVIPVVLVLRQGWRGIASARILVDWIPAALVWAMVVLVVGRNSPPIVGVSGIFAAWLVTFAVALSTRLVRTRPRSTDLDTQDSPDPLS